MPQRQDRCIDRFVGQLEGAEMYADAAFGAQIAMRADRFLRVHVMGAHEPARLVSADRQQREIDARKAMVDFGEVRA